MSTKQSSLSKYYKQRAPVYDRVYSYPERQNELRHLEDIIPKKLKGFNILEIAAGTGYWTQFISKTARSIIATDINEEPLQQLTNRNLSCAVEISVQDAFSISQLHKTFDGIFAALWLSHIQKQYLSYFFEQLHLCANANCKIILLDNTAKQCDRLPITFTDNYGNTYQDRTLDDGSVHRVLKNFPSLDELRSFIPKNSKDIKFSKMEHFWLLEYTCKSYDYMDGY